MVQTPERQAIVQWMESTGLIAIIRAQSQAGLVETARALARGGCDVMEITMTTPGALEAIAAASEQLGDQCLIGVGSVLDGPTVERAVEAGADFVVSPVMKPEVIDAAHRLAKPALAGALSPTEILMASEAGSDVVKVFPANHLGPRYFKDVLAPMPHLKLTPTGGVNLDTVADWFEAGACCLGVGSALVRKDLIANEDWDALSDLAGRFTKAVREAR